MMLLLELMLIHDEITEWTHDRLAKTLRQENILPFLKAEVQ